MHENVKRASGACRVIVSLVLIIQEFVFEMLCGINEFDHRILALFKQERERPEKFSLSFCLCALTND